MDEHRSACAQYESDQAQQFHVFVYETTPDVRHRFTRFPVMPDWWRQDGLEIAERRAAVYADFDSSEIAGVIVDLADRIDHGIPKSANDVAACVRRHQPNAGSRGARRRGIRNFSCLQKACLKRARKLHSYM